MEFLSEYSLFLLKAVTIVIAILLTFLMIVAIKTRNKKPKSELEIKKLNDHFTKMSEILEEATLDKNELKQKQKEEKKNKKEREKQSKKEKEEKRKLFVLNFDGDIKASAVDSLREEITALLSIVKPQDEIVVKLESAGGMVHAYGLAASQLQRIRDKNIHLTVCIDKVAASGGYLMACVADRINAAPFAIVGSIGVVAQIPNFHRLLKKKDIDFELMTAGEYKRTLTIFGENTDKDREKFQEDLEDIHQQFKDYITQNRPKVDIQRVATGEHWLAKKAYELKLVDNLITSDDYLLTASKTSDIYEVTYSIEPTWLQKLLNGSQATLERALQIGRQKDRESSLFWG